jgi:hypothetical protein
MGLEGGGVLVGKCARAANVGYEPFLTNAAYHSNVFFSKGGPKGNKINASATKGI